MAALGLWDQYVGNDVEASTGRTRTFIKLGFCVASLTLGAYYLQVIPGSVETQLIVKALHSDCGLSAALS